MPSYAGPSASSRSGDVAGTLRLLAYLALAFVLMLLDQHGGWLARVRGEMNVAVEPVWWVAALPGKVGTSLHDNAGTLSQLTRENAKLRDELLVANAQLTRLSTTAAENAKLRGMLGTAESKGLDVQLAPVLDIDLDPSRQRLILAAGGNDGVHVGQGVIDAGGLVGQIVQASATNSTVLLITDPDHAVPAMVGRNGVRLVVYGNGHPDTLELVNVPLNTDVKVGDLIVTSGLGGRFPAGFPVGTVTELHHDDSRTFIVGELKPAAQLDRGRDVLLLKSDQVHPPVVAANPASSAAPATASVLAPAAAVVVPKPVPAPKPVDTPLPQAAFADVVASVVRNKPNDAKPADKNDGTAASKPAVKKPAVKKEKLDVPKPDVGNDAPHDAAEATP